MFHFISVTIYPLSQSQFNNKEDLTPFDWIMIYLPGWIITIIYFTILLGIWFVIQWIRSLIAPDVYWNPFE
tara:strand:+ start:113 stop:325 length:213 start_codon:yes stop_codon:yes gene_type:complete